MNALKWARAQWDRVAGCVLVGVGAIAMIVGWSRMANEALTAKQIPLLMSGGLGGLFLLGVGATLWLSADLRDEWRMLDSIDEDLRSPHADAPATAEQSSVVVDPEPPAARGGSAGNGRRRAPSAQPARPARRRSS